MSIRIRKYVKKKDSGVSFVPVEPRVQALQETCELVTNVEAPAVGRRRSRRRVSCGGAAFVSFRGVRAERSE